MGPCSSAFSKKREVSSPNEHNPNIIKPQGEIKKNDNPHSIIKGKKDEFVNIHINEIQGDMVRIEGNTNCEILIMDRSGAAEIQQCKKCSIFIGPCSTSVNVRDCSDITVISASNQLRITNVKNGNFICYTNTPPGIDLCENIQLSCLCIDYLEMLRLFSETNLNIWGNCWSEYIIFTQKGNSVKLSADVMPMLEKFPKAKDEMINMNSYKTVPFTYGKSYNFVNHKHLILILRDNPDTKTVIDFLEKDELKAANTFLIKTLSLEKNNSIVTELLKMLAKDDPEKYETLSSIASINNKEGIASQGGGALQKAPTNSFKRGDLILLWFTNEINGFEKMFN